MLDYGCGTTQTQTYFPRFNYVTCYVQIRRRSAFYVANLIAPMTLTSLMTILVFWIPAETEEKISFLVSLFTSTSVFLNYVIDMIPRSIETIPRVSLFVFAINIQVILATAATALVLRRYRSEQQHKRQKQEVSRRKWSWLLHRLEEPKTQLTDERLQYHENVAPKRNKSNFAQRKNIVRPEVETAVRISKNHPFPVLYHVNRSKDEEISYTDYDTSFTNSCTVDDVFSKSSSRNPQGTEVKDSWCLGIGHLTYEKLDQLFFVLIVSATITIYLFIFLI